MSRAFVIDARDNVATALAPIAADDEVALLGARSGDVRAAEAIREGHKIALETIPADAPVVKYGMPIGRANAAIRPGQWVHLHNCRSNYDARSGALDNDTGAPRDTQYV